MNTNARKIAATVAAAEAAAAEAAAEAAAAEVEEAEDAAAEADAAEDAAAEAAAEAEEAEQDGLSAMERIEQLMAAIDAATEKPKLAKAGSTRRESRTEERAISFYNSRPSLEQRLLSACGWEKEAQPSRFAATKYNGKGQTQPLPKRGARETVPNANLYDAETLAKLAKEKSLEAKRTNGYYSTALSIIALKGCIKAADLAALNLAYRQGFGFAESLTKLACTANVRLTMLDSGMIRSDREIVNCTLTAALANAGVELINVIKTTI